MALSANSATDPLGSCSNTSGAYRIPLLSMHSIIASSSTTPPREQFTTYAPSFIFDKILPPHAITHGQTEWEWKGAKLCIDDMCRIVVLWEVDSEGISSVYAFADRLAMFNAHLLARFLAQTA